MSSVQGCFCHKQRQARLLFGQQWGLKCVFPKSEAQVFIPWFREASPCPESSAGGLQSIPDCMTAQEAAPINYRGAKVGLWLQTHLCLPSWDAGGKRECREQMNTDATVYKWQCLLGRNVFPSSRTSRACTEKQMSHGVKRKASSGKLLSLIYFADKNQKFLTQK